MIRIVLLTIGCVWLAVLLVDLILLVRHPLAEGRRRSLLRFRALGLLALGPMIFVAGGWLLSTGWAWAALGTGLAGLFALLAALFLVGYWSARLVLGATALLAFGVGAFWLKPFLRGVEQFDRMIATLTLVQPLWLLLLLSIPFLFLLALRQLRRDAESWRPWLALLLRSALFALLTLALAEPLLTRGGDRINVLFVIDRSASITEDLGADPDRPGTEVDRRSRRIVRFIRNAVEERKGDHDRDSVGLVVFGRDARLEMAPSDVPDLTGFTRLPEVTDPTATDIGAALEQAISSFLPDSNKRIVLLSDGNENLGRAEDVARKAHTKGIEIDVVPLGAGQRNEDEVLIENIHTERLAKQGGKVEVNVQVRSYNPNLVVARLTLRETTDEKGERKKPEDQQKHVAYVALVRGLNPFVIERPLADKERSYSYEAEIEPLCEVSRGDEKRVLRLLAERAPTTDWVKDAAGVDPKSERVRIVEDLNRQKVVLEGRVLRDRKENNTAAAHLVARGKRRVLIIEESPKGKEEVIHSTLVEKLKAAGEKGEKKFEVEVRPVSVLNRDRDQLAAYLTNFGCIILANVPCDAVSEEAQEELRKNTHDHGCGLIMIGGENGFGSGGWQNTAVEKALPVDCDIKSLKIEGKGGLVLIMHAYELAQGNSWEKKIARFALDRLGPRDEIGIIEYIGNFNWAVKLQEVGPNKAKILAAIDRMIPGDMPDVTPALKMAHDALTDEARGISAKHVIFITDGDPQADLTALPQLKKAGVTVTTVIVIGHGADADKKRMQDIAAATKGRYYFVQKATDLPAIYIKESRLVSQAFLYEKKFTPVVTQRAGPTKNMRPDPVPNLGGFVRTTAKPVKNVIVAMRTPKMDGQEFPLLAHWDYGLGKAAAFTSDAGRPKFWSQDWVAGGDYAKLWEQTVDWCMRPTESERIKMKTRVSDGRIFVRVEAEDDDKQPDSRVRLQGRFSVTSDKGGAKKDKRRELRFVRREGGVYEAEIRADEKGTYIITALATRKTKEKGKDVEETVAVTEAETMPLAPEYMTIHTNKTLLERLATLTGGRVYDDDDDRLQRAARDKELFRPFENPVRASLPLWYWLVFVGGFVLLLDVAARRIAIDTGKMKGWFVRSWLRLRGEVVPEPEREVIPDRLQARKMQTGRAERRFEADARPVGPLPTGASAAAPPAATEPRSTAADAPKPAEEAAEDVMSRLARAKKKIMDERKKDK